jgi:CRP/FNR family cyclic AMP-dependent transcriptional regulator
MNNTQRGVSMSAQTETMATRVALHPFLAGMDRTHLAMLADCAVFARFKKGQTILLEGEHANRFYLIESGMVILESSARFGDPVVIETIGPGDLLGWSWMFPPYTWHFTARAAEETTAVFFSGEILRQYCEKDRSLGFELFKRMSAVMMKRLQAVRTKMLSIHAHGARLEPVAHLSPFMEQELDTSSDVSDPLFAEGG